MMPWSKEKNPETSEQCFSDFESFQQWLEDKLPDDSDLFYDARHYDMIALYSVFCEVLSGYNNLKNFAIETLDEPECIFGLQGFSLRNLALKYGLIEEKTMSGPCSDNCLCEAWGNVFPCVCYKKTELLKDSSDE